MSEQPELVWEDPPEPSGGRGACNTAYLPVASALRENPKRWLRLGPMSKGLPAGINAGKIAAFRPRGAFEAVERGREGERPIVYVRYVGEPAE